MTMRDPMTVQEASKLLAVDERTLASLAEDRQVPAVKRDGQWVFSRKSLEKWKGIRGGQGGRA